MGRRGPPLPTAVNKWQLADPAGQAAVTRAGQPMSSPAAVAPPAAGLPLAAAAREGPQAASQGCGALFLGGPGRSAVRSVPSTGSPAGAASFLTFPTSWGRGRAVGVVWEGWPGGLQPEVEIGRAVPWPCTGQLEPGRRREIRNRLLTAGFEGQEEARAGRSRGCDHVPVARPGAWETPGSWLESLTLCLDAVSPGPLVTRVAVSRDKG